MPDLTFPLEVVDLWVHLGNRSHHYIDSVGRNHGMQLSGMFWTIR